MTLWLPRLLSYKTEFQNFSAPLQIAVEWAARGQTQIALKNIMCRRGILKLVIFSGKYSINADHLAQHKYPLKHFKVQLCLFLTPNAGRKWTVICIPFDLCYLCHFLKIRIFICVLKKSRRLVHTPGPAVKNAQQVSTVSSTAYTLESVNLHLQ